MPFHKVSGLVGEPLAQPLCDGKPDDTCGAVRTLDGQEILEAFHVTSSNYKVIYGILWALAGDSVLVSPRECYICCRLTLNLNLCVPLRATRSPLTCIAKG